MLHSLGAGSPCLATTSRMKDEMAEARTSSVRPASSSRMLSFWDFFQWDLICSSRGTTRVSSPQRTSGCASSIARIRVVPLLRTADCYFVLISRNKVILKIFFLVTLYALFTHCFSAVNPPGHSPDEYKR